MYVCYILIIWEDELILWVVWDKSGYLFMNHILWTQHWMNVRSMGLNMEIYDTNK
jgi:hypothetical protein